VWIIEGGTERELLHRGLSRAARGLYKGIWEFGKTADPFFKTSDDPGVKDLRLSSPRRLLHLRRTCRAAVEGLGTLVIGGKLKLENRGTSPLIAEARGRIQRGLFV